VAGGETDDVCAKAIMIEAMTPMGMSMSTFTPEIERVSVIRGKNQFAPSLPAAPPGKAEPQPGG
jgi:hypothetical protein